MTQVHEEGVGAQVGVPGAALGGQCQHRDRHHQGQPHEGEPDADARHEWVDVTVGETVPPEQPVSAEVVGDGDRQERGDTQDHHRAQTDPQFVQEEEVFPAQAQAEHEEGKETQDPAQGKRRSQVGGGGEDGDEHRDHHGPTQALPHRHTEAPHEQGHQEPEGPCRFQQRQRVGQAPALDRVDGLVDGPEEEIGDRKTQHQLLDPSRRGVEGSGKVPADEDERGHVEEVDPVVDGTGEPVVAQGFERVSDDDQCEEEELGVVQA